MITFLVDSSSGGSDGAHVFNLSALTVLYEHRVSINVNIQFTF